MIYGIGFFSFFSTMEKYKNHSELMGHAKIGGWPDLAHGPSSATPLVCLLCGKNNFIHGGRDTKYKMTPLPGVWRQTPWRWPPCFFSRLSWLWLQVDLQVSDTEGLALFPNLLKCLPSANGNSVPDTHYPRTEEEIAVGDFCLDMGIKE